MRDLIFVESGDVIVFVIKNCNVIIKPLEEMDELLEIVGMSKITDMEHIHLRKELLNIIYPKDSRILWILDIDGDIILRNTVLPNTCK